MYAMRPALLILSLFVAASSVQAQNEVFTADHVAKLQMISSAEVSPNGRFVAYVLRVPRIPLADASGGSWGELHVMFPNGESRPFITGEVNVGSVAWKPDGKSISFLARRGKDKSTSLYVIPVDGGEARRVWSPETGVGEYSWSPDGTQIAYIASEKADPSKKKFSDKGFNQEIYEEQFPKRLVYVATPDQDEEKARSLNLKGFPSELHWSPNGEHLAVALAPTPLVDDFYMKRRVHVVRVKNGAVVSKFENPGKLGKIAWSTDGQHLAFIAGADVHDPNESSLFVGKVGGNKFSRLELGVDGDFDDIVWKDANTIAYLASIGVSSRFGEISKDGKENKIRVQEGEMVLSHLALSSDGRTASFLLESPRHPNEVALISEGNSVPRRMTNTNPWLADMRFAKQEVVRHKSRDGLELEGILVRPLDEKPGKRYPLILTVHGGPESHIDNGWSTYYSRPGQVAAAKGIAVFYPNYRGSTGRGVAFSKLGQSDYAGGEFNDLVDAVDHFVASGLVDTKKVGVTGGSYGGFASAWCATYHTKRFAASVMFVGISNQISKTGTTDIPNEMFLVHARKKLYGNWNWYLERSPIFHVEKARTPLLILHGKEDTRVHPSQSMELYRHFKVLGKAPVRLVFYPGEGHGNRKSAARYDYNLRMMRWFEHYLLGAGGEPPAHEIDYDGSKGKSDKKDDDAKE